LQDLQDLPEGNLVVEVQVATMEIQTAEIVVETAELWSVWERLSTMATKQTHDLCLSFSNYRLNRNCIPCKQQPFLKFLLILGIYVELIIFTLSYCLYKHSIYKNIFL
jgi:hypothetical protein